MGDSDSDPAQGACHLIAKTIFKQTNGRRLCILDKDPEKMKCLRPRRAQLRGGTVPRSRRDRSSRAEASSSPNLSRQVWGSGARLCLLFGAHWPVSSHRSFVPHPCEGPGYQGHRFCERVLPPRPPSTDGPSPRPRTDHNVGRRALVHGPQWALAQPGLWQAGGVFRSRTHASPIIRAWGTAACAGELLWPWHGMPRARPLCTC